jgi:hypothetical protein
VRRAVAVFSAKETFYFYIFVNVVAPGRSLRLVLAILKEKFSENQAFVFLILFFPGRTGQRS